MHDIAGYAFLIWNKLFPKCVTDRGNVKNTIKIKKVEKNV